MRDKPPPPPACSKLALAGLLVASVVTLLTAAFVIAFATSGSDGRGFLLIPAIQVQIVGVPLVLVVVLISLLREPRSSWLTSLALVVLAAPGLAALVWLVLF